MAHRSATGANGMEESVVDSTGMKTRNWYEIYVLFIAVGFAADWGLGNKGEVTSLLPSWMRVAWFIGLAAGAAVAVVGELVFTNKSLLIERAALIFLIGLLCAYTAAFVIVGIRISEFVHVSYVAFALLSFAAVHWIRVRQIRKQVSTLFHVYTLLPGVGD
jgi:hypothetical protein